MYLDVACNDYLALKDFSKMVKIKKSKHLNQTVNFKTSQVISDQIIN